MLDQVVKVKQSILPILYLRILIASPSPLSWRALLTMSVSVCFRPGMSLAKASPEDWEEIWYKRKAMGVVYCGWDGGQALNACGRERRAYRDQMRLGKMDVTAIAWAEQAKTSLKHGQMSMDCPVEQISMFILSSEERDGSSRRWQLW